MGKRKKVDIKKRRQKLIKEKRKEFQRKSVKVEKKATKELDIRLEKETNLYWIRAITGFSSAIIGRLLFGLIGWFLFLWMLTWWFIFPFVVNFFIFKYELVKEEWTWKNVILPGIGIFFFLFMIGGVLLTQFSFLFLIFPQFLKFFFKHTSF